MYVDLVRDVRLHVGIPLAVKLPPVLQRDREHGAPARAAGADGLVLFNRFYQPDFDLETLEVVPNLTLEHAGRAAAAAALGRDPVRPRRRRPRRHRRRAHAPRTC